VCDLQLLKWTSFPNAAYFKKLNNHCLSCPICSYRSNRCYTNGDRSI